MDDRELTGLFEIYTYDVSDGTETRITNDNKKQTSPDIWRNKIVWQEGPAAPGIYVYDTETKITERLTNTYSVSPRIYEDKIVYYDNRFGDWDIFLYDLDAPGETRITDDPADQILPSIYKDKIVWQDYRQGNWDIYMYDASTGETQITTDTTDQTQPAIYGDKIVWTDSRIPDPPIGAPMDIFMFDLSLGIEVPIITIHQGQFEPDIYGTIFEGRVVYSDFRNVEPMGDEGDIYMSILPYPFVI